MDGVAEIQLTGGGVALVDEAELNREHSVEVAANLFFIGTIASKTWQAFKADHTTYAVCTIHGRFELRLHRLVVDARKGELVDHKNRNGLDCTAGNLRKVTPLVNSLNRGPNRHGTSKFKGVYFHGGHSRNPYHASIKVDGVKHHLGCHPTGEDAARAYDNAAVQYWGHEAMTNQKLGLLT